MEFIREILLMNTQHAESGPRLGSELSNLHGYETLTLLRLSLVSEEAGGVRLVEKLDGCIESEGDVSEYGAGATSV